MMNSETDGNVAKGPLTGLRVTDFTWVVAGPFCTRTLADMGAEVIKIEARVRPDTMRTYDNHYDELELPFPYGAFDNFNRNKLGATINARHPKGLKLIKDLIAVSDVVTENFRGGVLERWGLNYEAMRQARSFTDLEPRFRKLVERQQSAKPKTNGHEMHGDERKKRPLRISGGVPC